MCAQATGQRDQRRGIPVGLGGGDAFPRRGCERSVDTEELLGVVVQQPFPEQAEVVVVGVGAGVCAGSEHERSCGERGEQLLHGDPPER